MEPAEETKPVQTPEGQVEKSIADAILTQAWQQIGTSRRNKRARFEQIRENEDLYHGIITTPSIRNPFNECFPYMAGFVDHLKSKIDDDSTLSFSSDEEADYKKTQRIQAFYEKISKSVSPNDCWDLKHRYAKTNALFSGVAIYKYFATDEEGYKSYLEIISHYDFHNEPRGGGQIENHLFCGQDNIYKTSEELKGNSNYDQTQVALLIKTYGDNQWKNDNTDFEANRNSRFQALGQDPKTNNYVGQDVIKLVEWYTTYKGVRYYVLFNERSKTWIRCVPLTAIFPDNQWPYFCWHTNEDPDVFWSKAPCDDARKVANLINTFLNQELYNRQKRNYGQRLYDPTMIPNLAQLFDSRPDGGIAVDTANGNREISKAVYDLKPGDLNGTLDLVTWLEQFTGKQIGYTSSSAGQSEANKKVGVFQGEIQQVEELIGIKNKSYRLALSILGMKFKANAQLRITKEVSVKVMGAKGIEWVKATPDDFVVSSLTVQPIGGVSELRLKEFEKTRKLNALRLVMSVNPQWKDRQTLLLTGFSEEDVKDAFSGETFAEKELMSEAAQAERDIVEGKKPTLNRGATAAFMQHIIDFATNTDDLPLDTFNALMDYASAHIDIVLENMNRSAKEMIAQRAKIRLSTPLPAPNDRSILPSNEGGGIAANALGAPAQVPGAGERGGDSADGTNLPGAF